jgi:hypothetical protein
MSADHHVPLTAQLSEGVAALREGRAAEAATKLEAVASDPAWEHATDMIDIRARVCSLTAQAFLESGRPADADRWCRQALRALRRAPEPDPAGLREVRELSDTIIKAMVAEQERTNNLSEGVRLASEPVGRLVRGLEPAEKANALARKAAAELQVGRSEHAQELATLAIDIANDADEVDVFVMASITAARANPPGAEALLAEAWRRAAAANEFNLISTLATAATTLNVPLPILDGPDMSLGD